MPVSTPLMLMLSVLTNSAPPLPTNQAVISPVVAAVKLYSNRFSVPALA
jgi:hypothetical protein